MKKKHRIELNRRSLFFIVPTLVLALCFCMIFYSQASADSGDQDAITCVESVLVKKGDTLSSIAKKYAAVYSYHSDKEYTNTILELNNMDSEYIRSGSYILLPVYKK